MNNIELRHFNNPPTLFHAHIFNAPTFSYRCLNDHDWKMLYVDEQCQDVLECSSTSLVSNEVKFSHLIDSNETNNVWNTVQSALSKRIAFQVSYHILTPHNHVKVLFEHGKGIFIKDTLIELQGFISDITAYVQPQINNSSKPELVTELSTELTRLATEMKGNSISCNLSLREMQVLVYLCQGMSMKEIGNKLILSSRTIEMHIGRLKNKLQCYTKQELRELFFKTSMGKKMVGEII